VHPRNAGLTRTSARSPCTYFGVTRRSDVVPVLLSPTLLRVAGEVERTRDTYDAVSDEYHRRTADVWPALIPHLDWFAAATGPAARVADVGCGPGRDTLALRERRLTVLGIDLSLGQLRTGGLSDVVVADMRSLPIRSGGVDGVWCQAALLHVPRADVRLTLDEFRRALRPGGLLFLCTAEGDREGWETGTYGSEHPRWFVYHRQTDLVSRLERGGFDVLVASVEDADRKWVTIRAHRR